MNNSIFRVFYFDIVELYQNLFITIYDEDENDADDFMGRLCIPILEMLQDQKTEYRLKTKQLDKFFQGSITITCSRYYNPIRGNLKLFKPMDEGKIGISKNSPEWPFRDSY